MLVRILARRNHGGSLRLACVGHQASMRISCGQLKECGNGSVYLLRISADSQHVRMRVL
jgi:hypothetical protein